MENNDKIGKSGEGAGVLCTFGRRMKNSNANDARNFGVPTTILRSGFVGCDRKKKRIEKGGDGMRCDVRYAMRQSVRNSAPSG